MESIIMSIKQCIADTANALNRKKLISTVVSVDRAFCNGFGCTQRYLDYDEKDYLKASGYRVVQVSTPQGGSDYWLCNIYPPSNFSAEPSLMKKMVQRTCEYHQIEDESAAIEADPIGYLLSDEQMGSLGYGEEFERARLFSLYAKSLL